MHPTAAEISHARHQELLAAMGEGFVVMDETFRVLEINAAGLRLDGRPEAALISGSHWALWPWTVGTPLETAYRQCMSERVAVQLRLRYAHKDRERWLDIRAYPVSGGIASFYRDVTADVQSEQALRVSEDRFRAAVAAVGVMWTNDADGRMSGDQPGWAELTGQSRAQYEGYGWASAVHPDDAQPTVDAWHRAVAERRLFQFEHRVRRADGEWRHFVIRAVPVFDVDGAVREWVGVHVDITAERRAAQHLRELNADLERQVAARSRERSRTWMVSPDLLSVIDFEGRLVSVNPAWTATLGWSADELMRLPFADLLHPDDTERTAEAFDRLLRNEPVLRFENRYLTREGGYRWLSWVSVPEDGVVYSSARDVTEQRRQAEALAERTAERDRAWNNSRDLIVMIDADGIFRAVSPAWTRLLGHTVDDVVGRSFTEFVWPDDALDTRGALDDAVARHDLTRYENRYRHLDGTPRWISWHSSKEGELVYGYGRDVTAEKRAEKQLQAARDALRQSQKMEAIGQLTGGIAHDFNNLLQVISGNLQLIGRYVGTGNEKVTRRLAGAEAAVRRGAQLSSQLLAFARRQALDPKVINVGRLVVGMDDMLRRALGEGVELEASVSGGLWNTLVDPGQVENAVLNLAINARDAMEGRGKLTIEVGNAFFGDDYVASHNDLRPGQYVVLTVTDTGCGMLPGVLAQAFDPFFSTKPEGKGTGLGLSMVYGFVKQSGGHVKIYSEVGHGTSVKLYLPREQAAEDMPVSVDITVVAGGTETVLVVEDDDEVRATVVELLTELGYQVLKSVDAVSALSVLESGVAIDLLFTDVVMPGPLRSPELARRARERLPGIAVLFTSGYTENAIVHGGRLDAGVDLLSKPYTREALAAKVRQVLASRPAARRALPADQAGTTPGAASGVIRGVIPDALPDGAA